MNNVYLPIEIPMAKVHDRDMLLAIYVHRTILL